MQTTTGQSVCVYSGIYRCFCAASVHRFQYLYCNVTRCPGCCQQVPQDCDAVEQVVKAAQMMRTCLPSPPSTFSSDVEDVLGSPGALLRCSFESSSAVLLFLPIFSQLRPVLQSHQFLDAFAVLAYLPHLEASKTYDQASFLRLRQAIRSRCSFSMIRNKQFAQSYVRRMQRHAHVYRDCS